jgi:deoxyribodipyrimidine photo-lyase
MVGGLEEVERSLARYGIPFFLLLGPPEESVPLFADSHKVGTVVTDFSPLRLHRRLRHAVASRLSAPLYEVDAHNVVPCWITSEKREYAAATIRPKLHRLLPTFLEEFPKLSRQRVPWNERVKPTDWKRVRKGADLDTTVGPVDWLQPGEKAAHDMLQQFKERKLKAYAESRNDPTEDAQSNLSPYLHFGQIAPQRVALELRNHSGNANVRDAFLEELIVRRELSENFCFYSPSYDTLETFPSWAKLTLERHRGDRREHVYRRSQFESCQTHDPLWNAAQTEMVKTGKMHGFMRMYWAKKILEWTIDPESAMRIAIYLNDKYELDGHDPNGYAGIAWSIGGVHDRAWGERPIFGKIRYMSYDGCKRKFDVEKYIAKAQRLS